MNELTRITLIKNISGLLPKKLRNRFVRFFYPFDSVNLKGVDVLVDYYNSWLKFQLNTKEFIGWNIFFFGEYESETNKVIEEYIKPGDIVIEAGANNGSETLIIASILKNGTGKLYAFEPYIEVSEKLKDNIILNELADYVEVLSFALGNESREIDFFLASNDAANQGMSSKYNFKESLSSIKIKQVKLDDWVRQRGLNKLDFIKMDIQGSELELIKGGSAALMDFKPIIFTEASQSELKRSGNSIEILFNNLAEFNYDIFLIKGKQKIKLTGEKLIEGNWLAIPK